MDSLANPLAAVSERALEGILIVNEKAVVTFANKALLRQLGYRPWEMVNTRIFDYVYPGDQSSVLEEYDRLLHGRGMPRRLEFRARHKTRGWRFLEAAGENLLNDESVQGIIIYLRDITEQKKIQEDFLKIGEEEHRRVAEELHDGLTQELAGIEFLAKTLEQKIRRQTENDGCLAEAERMSRLLSQAVHKTRDLARGLYPVEFKASGFAEALQRMTEDFQKQTQVVCRLHLDKSGVMIQDTRKATHAYYLIREAAANAVRHGKASRVDISVLRSGERLHIAVRDNGGGISREKTGGTRHRGIGLKIMKHRTKMLNGTMDIFNNAGGGTTFSCSFAEPVHV